ncbi:hypothetical protein BKL90_25380 [Escherichia coli]|nr:hypothetical protein BKL90_25380 [Escherichia coli]
MSPFSRWLNDLRSFSTNCRSQRQNDEKGEGIPGSGRGKAAGTSGANPAAILIRQVEYTQKWKRPRRDDASVRHLPEGQNSKFWPYFTSSLKFYLFAVSLIFLLKLKQLINISHDGTNQIYGKTGIGFIQQSFSRMGHAVIVTQVIDPMKYCGR